MLELENRIKKDGRVIDNRILKVDSFLNHQLDPALLTRMGQELARLYADTAIDRIVTIETSGIAVAYAVAMAMGNIPVVFARKKRSLLSIDDQYVTSVYSYTKEEEYTASISRQYLPARENILIIDDFLASGAAALGLIRLVQQAGSRTAGIGVVIEKTFQPGRATLKQAGYRVEALASIESFTDNQPIFTSSHVRRKK